VQTRGQSNIIFPDLSSLQTIVDVELLISKSPAIILRAYGSNHTAPDTEFIARAQLFRSRGVPTGAYYFATPSTDVAVDGGVEADAQCDQFIEVLQQAYGVGDYGDLVPYVDVESWGADVPQKPMFYGMDGTKILAWVKRFRDRFNSVTKRKLGLYAGRWFMQEGAYPTDGIAMTTEQIAELSNMPLWLAEYDQYKVAQTAPEYIVPNWGGWTSFSNWQYDVPATASEWGVSHGTNQIDLNRIDSLDRLMPPKVPTNIVARMIEDNKIEVTFTRPLITDYIGANVFINGAWKAWALGTEVRKEIDITAYTDGTDISIVVESQDMYQDVGTATPILLHVYPTLAEAQASEPNLYLDNLEGGNFMPTVAMGTTIKKTDGAAIAGLTSISGLDLSADTIDVTTLSSEGGYREFTSSFRDAGEVSISGYFDYTSHSPLLDDFQAGSTGAYVITFPNGSTWTFDAVVVGFSTSAELEDLISFEGTLKVSGEPTLTAPTP
jgi:GH25 family lysozyme M1 (1,4-beta-N-acetylmuramidase)/predicted secreted protein